MQGEGSWEQLDIPDFRTVRNQTVAASLRDPHLPSDHFASTDEPAVLATSGRTINWVHAQPRYLERARPGSPGSQTAGW
jgi:hypothetical protein